MKKKNIIMASLLVFAMLASLMPLYDASAPAIETNAKVNILIENVTAAPSTVGQGSAVNITCDVTANGATDIKYVNLTVTDPENNTVTYKMVTNASASPYSGPYWNETTYNIAGVYHYIINVTDVNGDYNITGDNTFTVTDTTAPTISNAAATPSSVVEGNPVNITADVSDNVGVNSVKLTVKKVTTVNNTTTYEIIVNNTDMGNNNGTYYYDHIYGVGSYIFEIYADDAAGNNLTDNSTSNTFTVTADTAAPVISNVAATPTSVAQGGSVNVTADVTDAGVGVNSVMVNITYPDGAHHNETMAVYNGAYYYNTTYDAIGTYTFFVWANDTNGNAISSATDTFEVTDGTAPVIAAPNVSVNVNIVTITVDVTDNYYDATNLTVTIYLTLATEYGDEIIEDNTTMDLGNATTGTFEYVSGVLDFGDYNFTIYATDGANNDAAPVNGAFSIVDTIPPEINESSISISPANPVEGNDVTISVDVGDNIEVVTVTITVDGTSHNMTLTGGHYTYTVSAVTFGDHTFTITATDEAGLQDTYSGQFSAADADQPTATPSSENPTKATLGSTITIQYTASDPDGIATVVLHYTIDGVEQPTIQMANVNGTYSAEITLPKDGKNMTYWVEVTDNSGTTTTTQPVSLTLEKEEQAAGLDPMLLAGIGILILVIIIAAAMMMKKKGGAPSEEVEEEAEEEESEEEEFGEEEEAEEDLDEEEEL